VTGAHDSRRSRPGAAGFRAPGAIMSSRHATLIRAAQHAAAQYSLSTGHLLGTLMRELPYRHAEWVLELARRINDEATVARYQSLPLDVRGAGTPARSMMAGPGSAAAVVMMALR